MIFPDLTWFLVCPLITLISIFFLPQNDIIRIRRIALVGVFIPFLLAIWFCLNYDTTIGGFQFVEKINWVSPLGISLHLGIDGINSLMLLLLGIVSLVAVYISRSVTQRLKEYYILLLITIIGTYGAFLSLDIFFFYFFHEIAAVPVFLMMILWGSGDKQYAAMKLTLYLIAGAALALVGLIALYLATGIQSFDLTYVQQYLAVNPLPVHVQHWIFPLIVFGFGVTLTLWPFHTWAPQGYASAPTAISMLHAGVLKKMGAYAIIRFALELMPQAAQFWMPIIATLAVINILFCGFLALTQRDIKYLLGYSSCSHMGYILLGLAAINVIGVNGVVYLMFAHGIMAALAFALEGYITEQTKTRNLNELGGLIKALPFIGTCFVMMAMASAGVPGFGNFVAEILVLLAAWDLYRWHTVLAVLGIVITAIYMLKTIRLGFQGPLNPQLPKLVDANWGQRWPYLLLLAALIIVGCFPSLILNHINSSTKQIVERSL